MRERQIMVVFVSYAKEKEGKNKLLRNMVVVRILDLVVSKCEAKLNANHLLDICGTSLHVQRRCVAMSMLKSKTAISLGRKEISENLSENLIEWSMMDVFVRMQE
ncbi:hypothetical protein VNO77_23409 [Canavalia gladiata]|uniref:Uncharacterized protein n=1 Tax=Canavalia gladiata TaxID=3824 RepID=A0AAN9QBH2_CANGL